MPSQYFEKPVGGGGRNSDLSLDVPCIIVGAATFEDAHACVAAQSDATKGDRVRLDWNIEEVVEGDTWEGTVRYGSAGSAPQQPKATGDSTFTFDTTGATSKITQAIQEIGVWVPESAPDLAFGGAIGVRTDHSGVEVEGTEIVVPVFRFSVTLHVAAADMTDAYIQKLYKHTGKVNSDDLTMQVEDLKLPFLAGELLYMGAKGARRGIGDWELQLDFAGSPNVEDLPIGDPDDPIITVGVKNGWDYLWFQYQDSLNDDSTDLVKKPKAAVVDRIYQRADLRELNVPLYTPPPEP